MIKKMPNIIDCAMDKCSYNSKKQCHAMAITVGDGLCPKCDTCITSSKKGGILEKSGSVGACKVDECRFNELFECAASGVHIKMHLDHAECSTFSAK